MVGRERDRRVVERAVFLGEQAGFYQLIAGEQQTECAANLLDRSESAIAPRTALTVGGIVSGYIYSSNAAMQDSLEMAACTQAQARIEQARSAQWDVSAYPAVDQLVASNFPNQMVTLTQLDSPSNTVSATVQTTISQVSVSPPVRLIHVDCIWQYRDYTMTSSVETMRAPDE